MRISIPALFTAQQVCHMLFVLFRETLHSSPKCLFSEQLSSFVNWLNISCSFGSTCLHISHTVHTVCNSRFANTVHIHIVHVVHTLQYTLYVQFVHIVCTVHFVRSVHTVLLYRTVPWIWSAARRCRHLGRRSALRVPCLLSDRHKD